MLLLRSARLADGPSEEAIALSLLATHNLIVAEGKEEKSCKEAQEYYDAALEIEGVGPEIRGRILCNSAEAQLCFKSADATSVAAELLCESIKLLSPQPCSSSVVDKGDVGKRGNSPSLIALGWSKALAGYCYR